MIKYKLNCKDCAQSFDSWFATSKEYDRVKKMNLINCHNCNSTNIDKSLIKSVPHCPPGNWTSFIPIAVTSEPSKFLFKISGPNYKSF